MPLGLVVCDRLPSHNIQVVLRAIGSRHAASRVTKIGSGLLIQQGTAAVDIYEVRAFRPGRPAMYMFLSDESAGTR